MLAGEASEALCSCVGGFEAGDEENGFLGKAAVGEGPLAIEPGDLRGEREVDLGRGDLAAEDGSLLEPAVAFFEGATARGKKRSPAGGARSGRARRAGCF